MIRAYDDNGNVVDLVEWERKIRIDVLKEYMLKDCDYCKELMNRFLDEYDKEIIDECIHAISENTLNPTWEYGEGVNDSITALEQLKEQRK